VSTQFTPSNAAEALGLSVILADPANFVPTPEELVATRHDYEVLVFVAECVKRVRNAQSRLAADKVPQVVNVPLAGVNDAVVDAAIEIFTRRNWNAERVNLSGWVGLGPHLSIRA